MTDICHGYKVVIDKPKYTLGYSISRLRRSYFIHTEKRYKQPKNPSVPRRHSRELEIFVVFELSFLDRLLKLSMQTKVEREVKKAMKYLKEESYD